MSFLIRQNRELVPFFKLGMGAEIRRDDGFLYENQKIESRLKMI
jgi:hypothetical protein